MKKSKSKRSKRHYRLSDLFYNKKNWKVWLIVYGGVALIFYSMLYFFGIVK